MDWRPIAELDDRDRAAPCAQLPALTTAWAEQRESAVADRVEVFNRRLMREWSIETGILERIYRLDRTTSRLLVERGFDPRFIPHDDFNGTSEKVVDYLSDHLEAVEWLYELAGAGRPLTESLIKQMHALLVRSQDTATGKDPFGRTVGIPLRKGEYKIRPNNPTRPDGVVHEYCPPEQVTVQMERMLDLYGQYRSEGVSPEVVSAWLHHRFVQIHPFQDGNGRTARAISSLVFIQTGLFPLVIDRDQREGYFDALQDADGGDLRPLVDMFASNQRAVLTKALNTVGN